MSAGGLKEAFFRTVHGPHHHWWALGVTSIGTFMTAYDLTGVSISLPQIMTDFKASLTSTSWVVLAFLLTTTILLLPAGYLGDRIGRKKVYNLGFVISGVGSLLCGLARDPTQLIVFRVLQAVGGAMLQTNSFAIVSAIFPDRERGKGLGLGSTVAAIGATAGPALGGFIVSAVGWRGVFFVSSLAALIGIVLGHLILLEKRVSTSGGKPVGRLDLGGIGISAVAVGCLLVGLSLGQEEGWSSWSTLMFLGSSGIAMIVFPLYEAQRENPLVDVQLFRIRAFAYNNIARLICFVSLSASTLLMPFFLQLVLGYSAAMAGMLIAPMSLVMAPVAATSGWLTDRMGSRFLSSAGMAVITLSLVMLSRLNPASGFSDVLWPMMLMGLGLGIFQTPNNTTVMDSVPRKQFGMASGMLSLVRQAGQAMGIAMGSTIVAVSLFSAVGKVSLYDLKKGSPAVLGGGEGVIALANAIDLAFVAAALLSAVGLAFCLLQGKSARGAS